MRRPARLGVGPMGPLLFNMYTSDISKVVESHGLCRLHQYADDCQVYLSVPVTEAATAVDQLSQCVANVSAWLSSSRLRLSPLQTLVIWLGRKHQVTKVSVDCVPILSTTVPTVESVRDLGLVLDSQLTTCAHVNSVCRSAYYQLRQLRPVVCSLSADAARTVVQAFVSSRLDYCNSAMYGAADGLIRRLQAVQNAAERLVTGTQRRNHISPVLRQLQWLPVRQRVITLAVLVFKALQCLAPRYRADDCQLVTDAGRRHLSSSQSATCVLQRTNTRFSDRVFRLVGPSVWNSLPADLRHPDISLGQFHRALKTFLFNRFCSA